MTRATASWFWSLVAERQGTPEDAALLAGFSKRIGSDASYAPLTFDAAMIESSQAKVRQQLGDARYEELFTQGAITPWDDLPVVARTVHDSPAS